MAYAIVDEGQNMMDMALQWLGDQSAVFDLAMANGFSMTGKITAGQKLKLPAAVNADAAKYFTAKGIVIATEPNESTAAIKKTGINYMQIGTDFIVSPTT